MNFYRILKNRRLIFLFASICAFLCAVGMPELANVSPFKIAKAELQVDRINKAKTFQANGQYRQACKSLVQGLELTNFNCQQLIDEEISTDKIQQILKNLPVTSLKVSGLTNLGELLRLLGALNSSQAILTQTLEISQKLVPVEPNLMSNVYLSLGNTKRALGKREQYFNNNSHNYFETAFEYYQKAIKLSTYQWIELRGKNNLLNLIVEDYSKILEDYPQEYMGNLWQEIQLGISELPVTPETIYLSLDFAQTLTLLNLKEEDTKGKFSSPLMQFVLHQKNKNDLTSLGVPRFKDIVELVAQATQQAQSLDNKRLLSYGLGNLGELYEINQQWEIAKELTEEALQLAQSIRAEDLTYRLQWQLGRLSYKINGNNPEAIAAYTTSFETLQPLRKDLASINRDLQFSFRDEVEPVYRQFVEILLEPQQPDQEKLKLARRVIEGLQLAEIDDFFREACVKPNEVTIDKIDPKAAVIYPIILSERLEVILSLPNETLLNYKILESENDIRYSIDLLRLSLDQKDSDIERNLLRQAKKIYQWLIEPAIADLENNNIETLVFVLDGALRNIPMAVLHDGHQYLIEKYRLALTPGLQLLNSKELERKKVKVLAAGRSKFKELPPLPNLDDLENIPDELKKVSQEFPIKEFLNEDFTKTAVQTEINSSNFPIVHIATHGKFSSKAEETYIIIWNDQIKVNELDNLLRTNELSRQEIQLLVLSACQTAEGDDRAALGMAGVALKAGARTTLASLWNVQDKSTAQVMAKFYQELKNPTVNKAEALRRAQLSLLKGENPNLKNPHYWAPFVLVGNWL